jgi:hypothetical protein
VIYFIPLFLTFWLQGKKVSVLVAGLCTLLIYLNLFFTHVGEPVTAALVNRSLGVLVLWVMALLLMERKQIEAEREKMISQLQDAMAEIKILQGVLPVCASCKKIRDDKGTWHPMETYISTRTDTVFSHGLCPDCLKQRYPDYSA